jgi:APA family basic amino acid/polyamine antiporter
VINATVILLRVRHPRLHRPFRVPGSLGRVPIPPLLGVITSVVLLVRLDPVVLGLGTVLVALGAAWALLKIRGGGEPGPQGFSG